jgi:lipase
MTVSSPQPAKGPISLLGPIETAPVTGGMISYAQAGPPHDEADAVVLAIHGVTSNLMAWCSVVRALARDSRVHVVAPDLRGRAESAALPGPYGIAAHVADMRDLLEHLDIGRAVLVGHSMGAYVAARLAAEQPDRAAALVLVDGGVYVEGLDEDAAAAVRASVIGPAVVRHALTFSSVGNYLNFWRSHPALTDAWNDEIEAYALHELRGSEHTFRSVLNLDAIETDSDEMLFDPVNRTAIERAGAPVHLLRAPRGAMDEGNPMIPEAALEAFIARHPTAAVEQVDGVNHYTIVMGDGPGPARVAAAISAATDEATTSA